MKYLDFLDLVHDKILSTEIDTHPFPHLMFKVDSDKLDFTQAKYNIMNTASGRVISNFNINSNEALSNKIQIIGDSIKDRFNVKLPAPRNKNEILKYTQYSELWEDSHELDIQEIHLDYLLKPNLDKDGVPLETVEINDSTQTVYSMHIYIPDDNTHADLGTRLYSEPSYDSVKHIRPLVNTNNSHDYMKHLCVPCDPPININGIIYKPYEVFMNREKVIPYQHGYVFIHKTTPNSWHSAPKVPEGYIRKSIMTRWDYTLMVPK